MIFFFLSSDVYTNSDTITSADIDNLLVLAAIKCGSLIYDYVKKITHILFALFLLSMNCIDT